MLFAVGALCTSTVTYSLRAQASPSAFSKAALAASSSDPLLDAMRQELDRERTLLVLPGLERPYFIEYRLDDLESYDAVASYGALAREEHNHQRVVRVTVRVGDYTSDSSSNKGEGSIELAPEDNDPVALQYALWTTTDEAYKTALQGYARKQATLKRFEKQATERDFSPAKALVHLEPLVPLKLDEAAWKQRIVDASGAFRTDPKLRVCEPHVQYSSANVHGIAMNRWLVNSEGTVLRQGSSGYSANMSVGGQANDGMRLSRDNGTTSPRADELESAQAFHQRAVANVESLEALRNAPLAEAEDFHGPVLFSGDAAADVLHHLFVPNVLAERPETGTTARTTGAYQSSYRARVLPEMLSAMDDPRVSIFAGKRLVGAYAVDDEGVPAEAVPVVERGKLMNYLTSRTPICDFPISNGHGRAAPAQSAHAQAGVMIFKANQPLTPDEMQRRLVAMAKEQGRDVYAVETLGGAMLPRLLYRVHADGSRQLVRGAVFDELDTRSLRSEIVAAGDDPYVQNTLGTIPVTIVAPSLLFGDIGLKRATEEQQKLPYYAPPTTMSATGSIQ